MVLRKYIPVWKKVTHLTLVNMDSAKEDHALASSSLSF